MIETRLTPLKYVEPLSDGTALLHKHAESGFLQLDDQDSVARIKIWQVFGGPT